ncbi:MAG: hypothetical protein ACI32C_02660 [Candidatus Enteromonas sp.]
MIANTYMPEGEGITYIWKEVDYVFEIREGVNGLYAIGTSSQGVATFNANIDEENNVLEIGNMFFLIGQDNILESLEVESISFSVPEVEYRIGQDVNAFIEETLSLIKMDVHFANAPELVLHRTVGPYLSDTQFKIDMKNARVGTTIEACVPTMGMRVFIILVHVVE